MCGIAGEIVFDRRPDRDAVERMSQCLEPRGPDGSGIWSAGPVTLAHRRLKIIDLTEAGSQPFVDEEAGLAIVFNGCIYNHRELRDRLSGRGHVFRSTSDTEVILRAYIEWGEAFVDELIGMFAFALTEIASGRTLLGRDRLGVKPLYTARIDDALRFASTLPALLAAGEVDTRIDPDALHSYMTFHSVVPAPATILRGVRRMPPATLRWVERDGSEREWTYWSADFDRVPERAGWSERDWQDAILDSLRTAVRRRLEADVPVGCLLSGGLDSSLIVGLLAEEGQRGLSTFSIGFESAGGVSGDEFQYSDLIAEHFRADHHQIRIDTARMLPALESAIGAMSEPMVSHDAVAFYLLSQEVSRHVKVVQSGQGADEVFAGYHWYPPLEGVTSLEESVDRYRAAFFDRDDAELRGTLTSTALAGSDVSGDFVRAHFSEAGASTGVDRALRLDTRVMLVDDPVKRVDTMTMAHGLEGRVPFLDHELVELAASCPPELKTAQGGKGVLKEAARRVVPAGVIDRPKGYFPVPALTHLQGPYLEMVTEAVTGDGARSRGLFDPAAVSGLLEAPNDDLTPLGGNRLWQIALLELWLDAHGIRGGAA